MTQIGDELKGKTEPLTSTMPQLCWLGLSWHSLGLFTPLLLFKLSYSRIFPYYYFVHHLCDHLSIF